MVWQPLQTPVTLAAAGPQNTTTIAATASITVNVIKVFFIFFPPPFVISY
jgi:hypothetical protein